MLAITMGDPNGIGPEIIYKYLKQNGIADICVIGSRQALAEFGAINFEIIDPVGELVEVNKGRAIAQNGAASYQYLIKAITMAKNKEIAAIVTAPLNKEALHLAGLKFDGHTEILAAECGTKKFGMMFYSDKLNIMLTTIHKSLQSVPGLITKEKFTATVELALNAMSALGVNNPRIGVCGLNPHAGEAGAFGQEEIDVLYPVIEKFQKQGVSISKPLPADTIFIEENRKKYDIIIAHYHDQGLIPLKMLAFDSAVNITVGLPIVRTSVDHGTAYDIVGKNVAHIGSLAAAVAAARKMVGYGKI